jgi:hypothetical protein
MVGSGDFGGIGLRKRWSQPLPLRVDPTEHRDEIARFRSRIVAGSLVTDCWVWAGALSDDGYGVFRIRRDGLTRVVRTSRYALAVALKGRELAPDVMALHGGCDNPVCVRVVDFDDMSRGVPAHVVCGDQRENMIRMARMRRGGGRRAVLARGVGVAARVERSRAIREAVKDGWDGERVAAALLGSTQPTLW